MRKNALYVSDFINGLPIDRAVRKILEEIGYDVYTFDYNYENVAETIIDIYKENWVKYDLIVAYSVGSFFSFFISRPPRMILINPCMKPYNVIPMSSSLRLTYMDQYDEIDYMDFSKKELDNTIFIFSKDDSICDFKEFFEKKNFTNILEIEGEHRPTYDQLKDTLVKAANEI